MSGCLEEFLESFDMVVRKENFEQEKDGIFNDTSTTTNDSNSKRKDRSRSHSLSRLRKGIRQRTNPRRRRGRSYDPFNSNSNSNNNINNTDGDAAVQQQQQPQYQIEQELDQQQEQARITLGRSRSCSVGSQKQQKKQQHENRRKSRSVSRNKDKTNNSSTRSSSSRSRSITKSISQRINGNKSNKKRISDLQLKIQQHLAAGSTSTFNVNDVDTKIEAAKQKVHQAEMETKSLKEKRLQYNAMKEEKLECSVNNRSNHKMISAAFSRAEELQRHQLHKARAKLEEQMGLARMMEHHTMWYEYYLKPYSMVVQKDDLFFNKENKESQQDNNEAAGAAVVASHMLLPTATTGSGCCGLAVNAICALCIDAYKEGDIVVWSSYTNIGLQQQHQSLSHSKRSSGCSHVFHKNCLIKWLVTKGKTHCPTCQQWYVPRQKIDDQQKLHGQSWIRALNEMKMVELVDNASVTSEQFSDQYSKKEKLVNCLASIN